jgi:hypothetical protein
MPIALRQFMALSSSERSDREFSLPQRAIAEALEGELKNGNVSCLQSSGPDRWLGTVFSRMLGRLRLQQAGDKG